MQDRVEYDPQFPEETKHTDHPDRAQHAEHVQEANVGEAEARGAQRNFSERREDKECVEYVPSTIRPDYEAELQAYHAHGQF
mmetsp:Transcript_72700/g.157773  ORF Transcript_72700/g.157773 Transcript_72700/m.157773 type:complete len:82 (-) Transcript_72700:806-1051(-)